MKCKKCGTKVDNNTNINSTTKNKKTLIVFGCIALLILIIPIFISIYEGNQNTISQANTQVETEEQKQERLKRQEENNKISDAISQFGEIVRASNEGSVKYSSYSLYKTTSNGTKVYKVKYSTSSSQNEYLKSFYYQLVSLNDDNTQVTKSTKLYNSLEEKDGSQTFDSYSMDYEAEKIWGK